MTSMSWILMGLFVLAGLVGSAFYSGAETGLYTLSRVRLDVRVGEHNRRALLLQKLIARPTIMLAVVLLANNISNYLSSFGVSRMLDASGFSPGQAVLINAAILVPILFVFGEVLPKDLFREHTDRWTYRCARPLEVTRQLLTVTGLVPLVSAVARTVRTRDGGMVSARQRVADLFREGISGGVLTESQTAMVDRALVLRDRAVVDEMIPWAHVHTISIEANASERRTAATAKSHTRLPVVDDGGRVLGLVSVLDLLLTPQRDVRSMMRPTETIAPDDDVQTVMAQLRNNDRSMAVIINEDGTPLGIVTMKDLVEVLVGELTGW